MRFRLLALLLGFLSVQSMFAQLNTELIGHLAYDDDMSNVWGYTNPDGDNYVIAGTYDGTSLVDVTDPADPVELQFINGDNSTWRQMSTWSHYAYVINETGGGVLCIDLSDLPGTADYNFSDGGVGIETAHQVWADSNGYVYVFGSNLYGGSTVILDANANPLDPEFLGATEDFYVHHGYSRNDTLWESNIYEGHFSVWDVSDKSAPVLLATQETPGSFTHNVVVNNNGIHLFSTDEVSDGVLGAYNVNDLGDIQYMGSFQPTPGSNSIPHYAWHKDNYVATAWYRDGLVITDATHPEAMVMTGWYDTSPLSGNGFNGAWGVYPYFADGLMAVTDIEEGLFLIQVDLVQACYLDGTITDASTGAPLFGVTIDVAATTTTSSTITGNYIAGILTPGAYDVTYSKPGYITQTISAISLFSGITTTQDVELEPLVSFPFNGQVVDEITGSGIPDAHVIVENDDVTFTATTDASGNFVIPAIFESVYDIYAGKWGHVTNAMFATDVNAGTEVTIELSRGYYDDFLFDFEWDATATASSGDWVKADPVGTEYGAGDANPENDVTIDYGIECYTTGNGGGSAGSDDVDDGYVLLTTPAFDLSDFENPVLSFEYWFFNNGGSGSPNDSLIVTIDNGITSVQVFEEHGLTTITTWEDVTLDILDYIDLTDDMHVTFKTGDNAASGHIVEAGIDLFYIYDSPSILPTAVFSAAVTEGCAPFTANFNDLSTGATSWAWTLSGASPAASTIANPTAVYNTPGTYDVSLTVSNALGSNTITLEDFITVYAAPVLSASPGAGSATVSISGGSAPYDVLWSDGQTTETATGLAVGTYSVVVTDANGCSAEASVDVTQGAAVSMLQDHIRVQVYPNPVEDIVNLNLTVDGLSGNFTLDIKDIQGKLMAQQSILPGNNTMNVSGLATGVYHGTLFSDGQIAGTILLIKQ
jgi:choice-of-anchor B domain-containing protein